MVKQILNPGLSDSGAPVFNHNNCKTFLRKKNALKTICDREMNGPLSLKMSFKYVIVMAEGTWQA